MNRAVLQTCFSTAWGGLEMVALELATRMQANGIAVTTVCTPGSPLAERLTQDGLATLAVERRGKYFSPKTVRTLRQALKSEKFSAVLVEQLNELWQVVPALRGMPDIQLVGISHTLVGVTKKDWLHRRLYGRLNRLVALTEIHRRNLLERLPVSEETVAVIPNAVDLRRFNPERRSAALRQEYLSSSDELLLGVVSRIDKGKGLSEVVEAAARLKVLGLKFKLIIAGRETIGEEGMSQILKEDISRRGLTQDIFLTGHRPDVEAVMASLDILIMPSPNETFGRVLIEAMASGSAVIASAGGGVPDIIHAREDGLLVPPLDVTALAKAMEECIRDGKLRESLRRQGLEAARQRYDQVKLDRQLYAMLGFDKI